MILFDFQLLEPIILTKWHVERLIFDKL